MNEHKEFYTKHLSPSDQMFLRSTAPLSTSTNFGKECFNNCISSTLEALENNNNSNQYSGVMGLIFFYE